MEKPVYIFFDKGQVSKVVDSAFIVEMTERSLRHVLEDGSIEDVLFSSYTNMVRTGMAYAYDIFTPNAVNTAVLDDFVLEQYAPE